MTSTQLPFTYRDFHDRPRAVFAPLTGCALFLDSSFDSTRDEYSDSYEAFLVPLSAAAAADWATLPSHAIAPLGRVPVSRVVFDPTFRAWLDLGSLRLPLTQSLAISDEQWRDIARTLTLLFRSHDDAIWRGIRRCFTDRGVDPDSAVLVEAALPSEACRVLIACTAEEVLVVTFDFAVDAPEAGRVTRWSDITATWPDLPFAAAVSAGLELLTSR